MAVSLQWHVPRVLGAAGFFTLPFLIFWWTFPYVSRQTLGNDYELAPELQMELQFALRTGTVPLFVPGFTGGQPASMLTIGQLFHPFSHLAARMPGYWSGHALDAATLLKLLSLGLTHLVLYRFLRRLALQPVPAWLVSFSTVYNLRMLDSFRYNVALEAYTGLLLLCASLGFLFLDADGRWPRLAIALSAFLIVSSGHPQWAYLALIGASVFCVALPFALMAITPGWKPAAPALRSAATGLVAMAAGVLLAAAYAVPFYFEFMRNNTARVGQSYAWATMFGQSVGNLCGSLYNPLHSDVHGSFAGNAVIVLAAGLPALPFFRVRVPAVMWGLWGFCAVVLLASAGGTPVYRFLFDHAPLWSSFRVPGRTSLAMIPAVLLLAAWAAARPGEERGADRRLVALAGVAVVALITWHVALRLLPAHEPEYSPYRIRHLPAWADPLSLGLLALSIAALATLGRPGPRRRWLEAMCALIIVADTSLLMFWGTWRSPRVSTQSLATMVAKRRSADWLSGWRYEPSYVSAPLERYRHTADPDPRFAWISHRCIRVDSLDEAYGLVRGRRWPEELIVEGPMGLCPLVAGEAVSPMDAVNLEYVSFNRMAFDVQSEGPGFLAVNLPYTRWDGTGWRAEVNGHRAPIVRANAIAQAVAIAAGRSRVELRFWSWPAFIGVLMSAATAAVLLAYAAGALPRPGWRTAARIAAAAGLALCVHVWVTRVRAGESWGTAYSWTGARAQPSPPAPPAPAVAAISCPALPGAAPARGRAAAARAAWQTPRWP